MLRTLREKCYDHFTRIQGLKYLTIDVPHIVK